MAARADVTICQAYSRWRDSASSNYLVITPAGVWYCIFLNATPSSVYWTKSLDRGLTWSNPVLCSTSGGLTVALSIWYDRWSGIAADVIHIARIETDADDVWYQSLDTASDTLGTEVALFAGATASAPSGCLSITRARGGNLYVAFDIDSGTELGMNRSTDAGATWAARATPLEAIADLFILAPGFAADNQDIMAMFWDKSADEISRKVYDDSADSWAETSIATGMVDVVGTTSSPQFAVAVDLANNRLLLVAWSNRDTANADLRFWTITESAITEGTNVVLNSTDDQVGCCIALDTVTGAIWVFYGGKSDGSETAGTSIGIYAKVSQDAGSTWGAETRVSQGLGNYNMIFTGQRFAGGEPLVAFFEDSAIDRLLISAPVARPRTTFQLVG